MADKAPLKEPLFVNGKMSPTWQRYFANIVDPILEDSEDAEGSAENLVYAMEILNRNPVIGGTTNQITVTYGNRLKITLSLPNAIVAPGSLKVEGDIGFH